MALSYGLCLGAANAKYTAEQFSQSMQNVAGDGVCQWGSGFLASVSGLALTLGSGFALAQGHWVMNDAPITLSVSPAYNHRDRQDIAAVQVDHAVRRVSLVLLEDADPSRLPEEPYTVPLYLLRVKRGATNLLPADLTDLRKRIGTLQALSAPGLRAYDFVTGGINREVERILGLGQAVIDKGDRAIADLDSAIANAGGMPEVGELLISRHHPAPAVQWLLCNGGEVPPEYPGLRSVLGDALPDIPLYGPRYGWYIFAGEPNTNI